MAHKPGPEFAGPLAYFAQVAQKNQWAFEPLEDGISLLLRGRCADYQVALTWHESEQELEMVGALDLRPPDATLPEVMALVVMATGWQSFAELSYDERTSTICASLGFRGPKSDHSKETAQGLLRDMAALLDTVYPAFMRVAWAGQSAKQAAEGVSVMPIGSGSTH